MENLPWIWITMFSTCMQLFIFEKRCEHLGMFSYFSLYLTLFTHETCPAALTTTITKACYSVTILWKATRQAAVSMQFNPWNPLEHPDRKKQIKVFVHQRVICTIIDTWSNMTFGNYIFQTNIRKQNRCVDRYVISIC